MKTKKLQVFISSTYIDLLEERQAAIEAILSCGHIPAGMELFTAGDQSQMNIIRKWIKESDVFLLILGGRYGSIEPNTNKSYIQLEYEYAVQLNKPLFSVIIADNKQEEKIKKMGSMVIENENPKKLKEFKNLVLTKMVKFYTDTKDIKLAIHETMSEFSQRDELFGWVKGDQIINTGSLAQEMARLTKENHTLRKRLHELESLRKLDGLGVSQNELIELMKNHDIYVGGYSTRKREIRSVEIVKESHNDDKYNLFHFFLMNRERLASDNFKMKEGSLDRHVSSLVALGIVKKRDKRRYLLTEAGRKIHLQLQIDSS